MDKEQRRRTRVPIQLAVSVRVADQDIPVTTKNISLKGLLCSTDPRLQLGSRCQVVLQLVSAVTVTVQGIVIRTNPDETAIDFLAMDEESFMHLKKIVEYNVGDADQITDELQRPAF